MRRLALLLPAAALALSACGTTVHNVGSADFSDELGGGNGAAVVGTDGTSSPVDGGGSSTVAGGTSGTSGATVSGSTGGRAAGTSGTTGPVAGPTSGATAPVVTRLPAVKAGAPIDVGLLLFPDVAKFATALGGDAGNAGSQQDQAQRAITWVNAHGGLAGHPIKPVFYNVSLTDSKTYAQIEQEVCTSFTQDHKVSVVMTVGANVDNALALCLAKKHVFYLGGGHYLHDDLDYRTVANMITPSEVSMTRLAKTMISELLGTHVLKSGDRLGLLVEDHPGALRAVNQLLRPGLKAKGITLVDYTIKGPSSTADIANSVTAITSAELKMATQRVNAVTFMCAGCYSFFMQAAESQGFYPRYFLTSIDTIGAQAGKNHGKSLKGATGLGWEPLKDVGGYSHKAAFTGNASRDLCHTIMKGFATDDTSEGISQLFCGGVLDLQAAAKALDGGPVNGDTLVQGFDRLGTTHASAVNFSTNLTAQRHDGANAFRRMHYDAATDAFVYDSAALHPFLA